ncbi:hypothetical protein AALP_AA4G144300 [Arabis alpina]|uniref:Uncharacterized protein n=1 Tax=Arabis alpina TaxID=50452 RepID=A0A087H394_ARAAL|nr:hypothetical protein AALP_AA4G144300 [Arabis alpina]
MEETEYWRNENWRNELDIGGLSLIDEDDSLLFSSSDLDPTSFEFSDTDKEDKGLDLFGDTHSCDEEILMSTLEGKESHESPLKKMMKYNLRKSLAWDKAFFTNAGVLEPDELSSMMESNHMGGRKILPTIQEDVNRSTESISTLRSDCTVENSQEFGLFEDVRALKQRSDKSKELGAVEALPSPTSTLGDHGSQEKMKPNDSRKRPSIRAQGLGKVTKQPVAAKEHNTSISRPLNGLGKTKRLSVDVNKAKEEKNSKLTGGKEPLARVPISRRIRPIVSKPVVPSKSALRSPVASKSDVASSCSSVESSASFSPTGSNMSSLDSLQQKKDQNLRIASHSLANGSTSRAASKNIGQPKVHTRSASLTSKSKLFSKVTRLSSSVDWTSETPRVSTPTPKIVKSIKKTVPGARSPASSDTTQTLKPLNNAKAVSAVQDDLELDKQGVKCGSVVNGSAVRSTPMTKPTGLRVPSPNFGYFDGARSSVPRTPTGSSTGPVSGLAKHGARSPNESTASRTKSGKSQPSTNSKAKVGPISRSPRLIVSASASSSPKLTNKMYSKVSAEEQLKGNEEDNVAR